MKFWFTTTIKGQMANGYLLKFCRTLPVFLVDTPTARFNIFTN
jgi:hypothetical protein